MTANEKQVGGTHYKSTMECWDYIIANNLGYLEGTAIKYITRWKKKNGIEDIRKAIHFLEKLVEIHSPAANTDTTYAGVTSESEGGITQPVDLSYGERFHCPLTSSKQFRNTHYPIDPDPLNEWTRKVLAQEVLNDYHARDI